MWNYLKSFIGSSRFYIGWTWDFKANGFENKDNRVDCKKTTEKDNGGYKND